MTNEFRRTLFDINLILNALPEEDRNKVPAKLRNFIFENRLENYESTIDIEVPIEEQEIHPDTQTFLGMLYLQYWCKDEEEKRELKCLFAENETRYQKEQNEKYEVFKDNNNIHEQESLNNEIQSEEVRADHSAEQVQETQIVVYKENIFKKILNKIFGIFRRKEYGK